jgi:hypothetical protein
VHKIVILIDPLYNETAFKQGWPVFLAQAQKLPGLRRESTSHVTNMLAGRLDYTLVYELFFDNLEDMKASLSTPAGRAAGAKLQEITRGRAVLFYADYIENQVAEHQESGNVTPNP